MNDTIERVDATSQAAYYDIVQEKYPTLPKTEQLPLFEPIVLSSATVCELTELQQALGVAVRCLTEGYLDSAELQSLIPLPANIIDLLGEIQDHPIENQLLRPDYIYTDEGEPRICEVNARFVFNGMYITPELAGQFQEYGQIPSGTVALSYLLDSRYRGIQATVVKGREPDYDMYYFKQCNDVTVISPDSLRPALTDECTDVVLELQHDELEVCLGSVVALMKQGVTVTNDPRTIFIGHDKRLLAALSDSDFLGRFVDAEVAAIVQKYVVPTWVDGWRGQGQLESAFASPEKYVAKLAISGKSQGYYDLQHFDDTDFLNMGAMAGEVAIQTKLPQGPVKCGDTLLEMAGTLPMTTEHPLGMGVARWYEHGNPHELAGVSAVLQESL